MKAFFNSFAILHRMYERWGEPDPFFRVSLTIGLICAFTLQLLMAVVSRYSSWDMLVYGSVSLAILDMVFIAIVAWACHMKKEVIMNEVQLKQYSSWKLYVTLIFGFTVVFALLMGAVFIYSG